MRNGGPHPRRASRDPVLPAARVVASTPEDRATPHAGELGHRSIHVERSGSALLIAEQVHGDEVGLALWPNPGADDRPQVIHRPPGQAASPHAAGQSHPGLRAIEGEVPALVLDDGVQQVDELGVVRLGDQAVVRREGGELVRRAPGHVERDEVVHHGRAEHRADVAELPTTTEPATDPQVPRGAGRVARVRLHPLQVRGELPPRLTEEPAERLAVPQLLVDPARQEGRDIGLVGRRGREQIAQVDRGVGLDVHHVCEAACLRLGERMAAHAVPGDAREIDALGRSQVPVEVESLHLERIRSHRRPG